MVLGFAIFIVAWMIRVQIVGWALTPIPYAGLSGEDLQRFIRSWGFYLEDRAYFVVTHREVTGHAQFVRRRYKTKADVVHFRVPFADLPKEQRERVRAAFLQSDVPFSMELTPKQKRDRALKVEFEMDDSLLPVKAVRCILLAFEALGASDPGGYSVCCSGQMKNPDVEGPELIPWRKDFDAGQRVGAAIRRLLHGGR